jgi:hypothetical protein
LLDITAAAPRHPLLHPSSLIPHRPHPLLDPSPPDASNPPPSHRIASLRPCAAPALHGRATTPAPWPTTLPLSPPWTRIR